MKAESKLAIALISASVLIMSAVPVNSAPHATVPGTYLDDFARTTLLVPSQGLPLSDGNVMYWNQTSNGAFSIQDSVLIAQYNAAGFYRFATASSTNFAYCVFRIKGDSRAKNNQIYTRIAGQPGSDTLGISDNGGISERELDTLVGPDSLPVPAITGQFQTVVVDMKKNGLSFGGAGNSNAFQIGTHAPMELDIDYIFMSNTNPLASSPPSNLSYKHNPVTYVAGTAITPDSAVVTGTVASYSVAPGLPAGLTLNTANGIITGTPATATAAAAYTVTATNTAGVATVSLSITVTPALAPPSNLTYKHNPVTYVAGTTITPDTAAVTGTVDSFAVTPALPAGLLFARATGIITGTPTVAQAAAAYIVTATNAAGSTTASLSIMVAAAFAPPAGLTYSTNPASYVTGTAIAANSPTSSGGAVASYAVAPGLPTGLTLNTTTGVITGTPTIVATTAAYVVTATNAAGTTTASLSIAVTAALAPPSNLTYSTMSASYTTGAQIAANSPTSSGGAVASYAVAPGLPTGLTLSTTTGMITGTPTTASATANYTVTASNAAGFTTASLSITVTAALVPPKAYFTASPLTGKIPLAVTFTDSSSGTVGKRYWYFGDNTAIDSSVSPTHTYATEGSFNATLVVLDASGKRADSMTVVIRTYKDNPVLISGRLVTAGSVEITYSNYGVLPVGPLPPFSDSIALWYKPGSIPLSGTGATVAKTYVPSVMQSQGKGAPIKDVIAIPQPFTDTVYGFITAVHWTDGTWSSFTTGNGCLVLVKDTSTPVNACVLRGKYIAADSAAVVVDSMKSIDTSSVDTMGIWYGNASTDTVPDFGNGAATKWFRTQDLAAKISSAGKDSIVIVNPQYNSGVVKTVWCAVILKGKNDKFSKVVKSSFSVGVNRPANPMTSLSAQAVSPSRIMLSWPSVTGVDGMRIVYRADTAVPLNNYYFDTTRYFVATPAVTDTGILVSGLQPSTHYYFGAQVYKNGLWSVVTQQSSADAVTPQGTPALSANRIKLDGLSFDTVTDQMKVVWKASGAAATDSLQVKIVYSTTGYPDSTQAALDQSKSVPVVNAKDTLVVLNIPTLAFNTKYYVTLWESRVDGALTAPTDSSEGTVTSPNYNWQPVTYFTKEPGDTAYAFNSNIRLMTDSVLDSTSVVRIMDKVLFWQPDPNLLAGFVPMSIAFKFAQPQSSARFYVGLKLLPAAYSANDIRIYRLQDSVWTVESTVVLDTQAGYVSVKTNNLSAVFMALLDTVAVTVSAEAHASVVPEFTDLYDTFTVSDNSANVKWQFMCALGGSAYSAGSVTGSTLGYKRSGVVTVHIPNAYVTGDNGVRARLVATDGVHTTVADVSRQVLRGNSDYVQTDPQKWVPLRVTTLLDSPRVSYALRTIGDTGKSWTYDTRKVRLFKWYSTAQNATSDQKWVEYSDAMAGVFSFRPGSLTWIKTRDALPVNFGTGITLPLDSSYSIPIAPNTWTDIALPYKFNVKVGDILDSTATGTLNADSLRIYSWQRDSTGIFHTQPLYISGLSVAGLGDRTSTIGCLDLTGYTIFNPVTNEQIALRVPAIPEAMSKYGQTQPLPKKAQKAIQGWAIKVVSWLENGSRLSDVYCAYDPPKGGTMQYFPLSPTLEQSYVGVYDAQHKKLYGNALTGAMTNGGCAYRLAFVNESSAGESIAYRCASASAAPMSGAIQAKVYNEESGRYEGSEAVVDVAAGTTQYRWLFVGSAGYLAKAPVLNASSLRLIGTSPNPFRGIVRIRYSLPMSGIDELSFTICDLRGVVVWRQAVGCRGRTGAGELTWSARTQGGRAAAAGIYVLRMSAFDAKGKQSGVFERKMTLLP